MALAISRSRLMDITPAFAASQILETIQEAVLAVDVEGSIRLTNPAVCTRLGYTRAELLGAPLSRILDPSSEAAIRPADLTRDWAIRDRETVWRTKDGRPIQVSVSASVMTDHRGSPAGIVYVASDISERKRIESQLRHSEKLAALGTLLGGVAHELNNPLFMISGQVQLLQELVKRGRPEDLDETLAHTQQAVERCSAIVNRFLRMMRSAAGRREACRLDEIMRQTLDLVGNDLKIHNISVQMTVQPFLPPIIADPQEILAVFLNLLANARQAIVSVRDRGCLTMTIESDDARDHLDIRISDDGSGIAPQDLPRIFDPFFTTKPVGQGTGLGLSICHQIVKDLGGSLACESTLGQGATFLIRLPVRRGTG